MNTKRIAAIILVVLTLCCTPVKMTYKDGGTVKYQAVLWSYTQYHQLTASGEYYEGTELQIFPFNFGLPASH